MSPLPRLFTTAGHALWRPWLQRRLDRVVVEKIAEVSLVVTPGVFNPAVFRSGRLLAEAVAALPTPKDGSRALDLGTGSGVGAVFAARRGYQVVATDLNPAAVRCVRINALLHGFETEIEGRQGDLFAPVHGERFDLVLFNPPYFRGRPQDLPDAAWRSEDVLERFAGGLNDVLHADGSALLVLSTDGDPEALLAGLRAAGFDCHPARSRAYGNETLTAWRARKAKKESLP